MHILNNDNKQNTTFDMTVLASHETSTKYLYPNVPIPNTLPDNSVDMYEFMPPEDSKLVLQVYQCYGEVNPFVSKDINKLTNGKIIIKI